MTAVAAVTTASQPLRFVVVGAGGYAINVAVFAWLVAGGTPYVACSIVSYLLANALMYLGNRYFTFRLRHEGFWTAYLRYVLVGVIVVAFNATLLALLVEGLGLAKTPAQAVSLLALTPVAFVLFKRWTFRVGRSS
jgi:putative flippase GtrA